MILLNQKLCAPPKSALIKDKSLICLIDVFVKEQDVNDLSKGNYSRVLTQFNNWLVKSNKAIQELNRVDILEFKSFLINSGYSDLTIGSYLSSVRRFFEWCESHKLYPNIAKGVKSPRRQQKIRKHPLTQDQCHRLLLEASKRGIRDLAIVSLLIGCGLRTIELIRANVSDISVMSGKNILRVHGKGHLSADDFVKIPHYTLNVINQYLSGRSKLKNNEPLFTSISNCNRGERLTTRYISKIVKECLIKIGLNSSMYSAHCLRHSTATFILKSGLSLMDVQNSLRHTNSNTTQIYTSFIKDELRLEDSTDVVLNQLVNYESSIFTR